MTFTPPSHPAWITFANHTETLNAVRSVIDLVGWDQATMMPRDSAEQRAAQLGYLEGHLHALVVDPKYLESLNALSAAGETLGSLARRAVELQLRKATKQSRLPPSLVTALSVTRSRAHEAWQVARARKQYDLFSPWLKELLNLKMDEARCLAIVGQSEYEALSDDYEPEVPLARIQDLLSSLQRQLTPIVPKIIEHRIRKGGKPFSFTMAQTDQASLNRTMLERMGFDFARGRLDISAHPFCGGSGADIRLTTRYDNEDWTKSFLGVVHEGGHGLFEQGMEKYVELHALRDAPSFGMHESQSRFWENHIARSRSFCEWMVPTFAAQGSPVGNLTPEGLYEKLNRVEAGFIRVDADEVTYNLHVFIRFEIERALFAGDLSVADLPHAWNEKYTQLLGITPPDDGVGVLQDMHWSMGDFGYFSTYTIGNLIAAQVFETISHELPLNDLVRKGDFHPIRNWLNTRVHRHGSAQNTLALVREVTGADLGDGPFIRYLEGKYLNDR